MTRFGINLPYPARYRDKGNPGETRSDHTKCHQKPRRLTPRQKEGLIAIRILTREVRNQNQHQKISDDDA